MTRSKTDTDQHRVLALLEGQNRILRMIATDLPFLEVITQINQFIESLSSRVICSTMFLNKPGTQLVDVVAPGLPEAYLQSLGNVDVGPSHGSCGTAAFLKRPVFVENIATNPLWNQVRDLALDHSLYACSSWPIIGRGGVVLGTFAFYYREITLPTDEEQQLIELSTDLTRIAIESFQADARTHWLAHHDELTGLENRFAFGERIKRLLAEHPRDFALLMADLDRFKVINDTLGHDIGDELIKETARRLRAGIGEHGHIARVGGDEFFILAHTDNHARLCNELLSAIRAPFFATGGYELHVTASLGVSVADADTQDAQTLIREADIALYAAKRNGRNTYSFYQAEGNVHSIERLRLESDLRHAVESSAIEVFYQPLLDVGSQAIVGVEALARWRHPTLGYIAPTSFIPIAEETGTIVPIGYNVLDIACQQMRNWNSRDGLKLRVSVNLSARQLFSGDLLKRVSDILDSTGLDGSSLELELTETMLIEPSSEALRTLNGLRALGVSLAVDDFGTGYSSLAYLKRLPLDCLKIDRSFVQDLPSNSESCAIAKATIALAHSLGMIVVAEGVETADQLRFLRDEQCDVFQGFYISPGVSSGECLELIRSDINRRCQAA